MTIVAAYSGTFDPITFGHTDIIERASRMFPRLLVAVGLNPSKNPRFTLEERVELVRALVKHLKNVEVKPFDGLIVDFARENGVTVLVRGVRTVGDFDYEKQMAVMNRDLYPKLDTVMLVPAPEHAHLSSSLVREIATLGAPIEKFVPAPVVPLLRERFPKKSPRNSKK
jgi:pantetheine-phosphate adenylyltransferase